nr:MAG TPA: hypothetical protein [Caudoviricetes sp.]
MLVVSLINENKIKGGKQYYEINCKDNKRERVLAFKNRMCIC